MMLTILAATLGGILVLVGAMLLCSPGKPEAFLSASGGPLADGISEKIYVDIGGLQQGMFIRGKSAKKPVLLFLHGGPGMPEYFLAEQYPTGLEDHFTVCYWEQRGAGLPYSADMAPEGITAERLVSDTVEVTNYLRERFGQDKIYLMAHSWGAFIGIQAAELAPDLYHAYIGVAQIAQMIQSERRAYSYMLEQYAAAGDQRMAKKLQSHPVLKSDAALRAFFVSALRDEAMHRLGIGTMRNMESVVSGVFLPVMKCRAYTLGEKVNIWRAKAFLRRDTVLLAQLFSTDLARKVPRLAIPVYFISGRYDYTVSHELSRAYLQNLQAPVKGFYTFEQSAHSPMFEEPEKFIEIMIGDVRNGGITLADAPPMGHGPEDR